MKLKRQTETDAKTGGQKDTKPERYDLLPWDALDELARVYGWAPATGKYAERNWEKGYRYGLASAALIRHFSKWMQGEQRDPESKLHHLAHAAWHCLVIVTFEMRGIGRDDRSNTNGR